MTAELAQDIDKGSPHDRYVRCGLSFDAGRVLASPLGYGKSGMMASLPDTEGLIKVGSGSSGASAGEPVEVLLLRNTPGH
ncbi:putative molybdopterin molybdenumtransferase MoeA [Paenibacillus sp. 598K]|nr:putative molybdopterin molybdenumtransferase MoeA [Paenibacillus sp. 598K]